LKHKVTYFLTLLAAAVLISSCGARRNNVVARKFHNTTTQYNYLYNAKRKLKEGTMAINAAYRVPPEGYIPVWWAGTEEDAKSNSTTFDQTIEICEIALQKHNQKQNKYFDDLRFVIGKSWFYKRNYILAISNFEHVIKTYPDSKLIPEVYMWMVRTHYMDDNNTVALKILEENLKTNTLKKKHLGELALIKAQVQLDQGKLEEVVRTLNTNKDFIKGANNKARVHYLLGQIYTTQKSNDKAYESYKRVTKLNTDYELIFNAKISMAKLLIQSEGGDAESVKLRRLLKKMLRDEKNIDYKDRIYYEMAMLDLKMDNQKAAIENLTKSIAANTNNQRQKALSYYKIGQIYFYDLKDFTHAQAYFDSASTSINRDAPEYREISTISATLKEYVGYVNTIHLQDSLLNLSKMSDQALERYVDDYLEEMALRKEEEEQRQLEEMNALNDPNLFNQFGENQNKRGSAFYFDEPEMVSSGKIKFEQVWGSRKNEDNWRRKNKALQVEESGTENPEVAISEEEVKKYGSAEKARMIKNVPRSEDEKALANQKVVEAMYGLGQVYNNKLNIQDSAVVVFNRLVNRFPDSEYTLKSRYALFKIYKDMPDEEQANFQKNKICNSAPNSRYCKYCNNEVFEDQSKESMEEFAAAYKALLETYRNKDYQTCISFTGFIESKFPEDQGMAEAYMIRGKSYGALGQKDSLISIYTMIRNNYPDSDVIPEVNRTLAILSGVPEGGPNNANTGPKSGGQGSGSNDPRYQGFEAERKPHEKVYVVMLIKRERLQTNTLQQQVNEFNSKYFAEKKLNVSVFLYQNTFHMPYISQFESEKEALSYLDAAVKDPVLSAYFGTPEERGVFISPANFRTAYGKKRMEDYFLYYENVLLPAVK
jgi:tetratricopeptide (TPR) repeat protein